MNSVNLMGRLTRDPELRYTASNVPVTSFTLAIDRPRLKEKDKKTDFIDCVAWRTTAEFIARNFGKGMLCGVSGRLQVREWTDKDGNNRRNTEVVVSEVSFGGDRKAGSTSQEFVPPPVSEDYGYDEYD